MNLKNLTPIGFCQKQSERFIEISTAEARKKKGQYFTPPSVAKFMAGLYPIRKKTLRLLDPGAGAGMLACAVCEKATLGKTIEAIHVDVYENDKKLVEPLGEALEYTKKWTGKRGTDITYHVIKDDFVLTNANGLWNKETELYDMAIANPPYFKIGKKEAIDYQEFVCGQPNIYALFMGVTAKLLKKKGILIYITPRSYTAGAYFKAFREYFFNQMSPERVHIFESRKDAFRKDDVLQENIILKAKKEGENHTVGISTSQGALDLRKSKIHNIPKSIALHRVGKDVIFRLPMDNHDERVIETVDSWEGHLHKYGMEISTGPVVTFRATELIPEKSVDESLVPLLWMHNVRPMKVRWPNNNNSGKKKRSYIIDNEQSRGRKLLVKNQNLVLLRRFSAKEEVRRLIAAPLQKGQLPFKVLGLENHLNYIYKPEGTMSESEILGIAALLNSALLDQYFRISNGNTQVSATELRAMPLPPLSLIRKVGEKVKRHGIAELNELNGLVEEMLGI